MKPPSITAALAVNIKSDQFESSAFDTAIYQQPEAADPPIGVKVAQHIKNDSPDEDRRLYIHANPAVHGMHSRSQAWYAKKALEIQARGGRKFWFGKAPARIRSLQRKRAESHRIRGINGEKLPERSDPQLQTYTRPLDFADVPEAELPEDVRQNPGWLKHVSGSDSNKTCGGYGFGSPKDARKKQMTILTRWFHEEVTRTWIPALQLV